MSYDIPDARASLMHLTAMWLQWFNVLEVPESFCMLLVLLILIVVIVKV